ncbi:MAG: MFS transporter [Chloroflexi bacterium]|nr:MFS transporter [Chloroflexota bacterium]
MESGRRVLTRRISPFVTLCLMGGLAILSSTMAKNPALPLFIRSMGVPQATVGFIAAASTVVGIIVSIPAGVLSDLIGRRKILLLSMFVFASAPFLYLLVQTPGHLVLVRIYHGLATAILGPVAMATVADFFDARRGERMGWYSSATMVGRFLAPTIGGLLIFGENFRWVYLADGVAGLLALLAALSLPRMGLNSSAGQDPGAELRRSWNTVRADLGVLFRNMALLATSLIEAAQYFAFGFVEVFLPIYLNEQLRLAAWQIGLLFTAQIVVVALSKPFTGRLSDRIGRIPLITGGLFLCAITMVLMPLTGIYPILMALIAVFGLGMAAVTASTSAFVADLSRATTHGAALGTLSSIMDVGHSMGPMVGGLMVAALGYQSAFGYIAVGLLVVAALYGWRVPRAVPTMPVRPGAVGR